MGLNSRQPTSNDQPRRAKNLYGPEDEMFALLNCMALRCCCCNRVIVSAHITIVDSHCCCPDCLPDKVFACDGRCRSNISNFTERNSIGKDGKVIQGKVTNGSSHSWIKSFNTRPDVDWTYGPNSAD